MKRLILFKMRHYFTRTTARGGGRDTDLFFRFQLAIVQTTNVGILVLRRICLCVRDYPSYATEILLGDIIFKFGVK